MLTNPLETRAEDNLDFEFAWPPISSSSFFLGGGPQSVQLASFDSLKYDNLKWTIIENKDGQPTPNLSGLHLKHQITIVNFYQGAEEEKLTNQNYIQASTTSQFDGLESQWAWQCWSNFVLIQPI